MNVEGRLFTDYTLVNSAADDDVLLLHDGNGVKRIKVSDLLSGDREAIETLLKKCAYLSGVRKKNLGSSFTAEQAAAIAAGDFSDLWNGDYWDDTTQGIKWRIVDNTNYMKGKGVNTPHLIIMPDDTILGPDGTTKYMMDTDSTTAGYKGTKYRSTYKATCKQKFTNFFGSSHVATYNSYISSASSNGQASGWSNESCDIELPTEEQMLGHSAWDSSRNYNIGQSWGRFRLFDLAPEFVVAAHHFWERNIVSATLFAFVASDGYASHASAPSPVVGLRPLGVIV